MADQGSHRSRASAGGSSSAVVGSLHEATSDCSPLDLGSRFRLEGFVGLLVGAKFQLAPTDFRKLVLGQNEPIEPRPTHVSAIPETPLDVERKDELGVVELALDHDPLAFTVGPVADRNHLAKGETGDLFDPRAQRLAHRIFGEEADIDVDAVRALQDKQTGNEGSSEDHLDLRAQRILPLSHETFDDLEDLIHGRLLL